MRKILCSLFVAVFVFSSANAAEVNDCEVAFPGHTESDELIFYPDDSGCPVGYVPTNEYKFIPDSELCESESGWTDVSSEFKEIVECDTSKGTCKQTYKCLVP